MSRQTGAAHAAWDDDMQKFVVNGLKDGLAIKIQVAASNAAEAGVIAMRDHGFAAVSNVVRLTGAPSPKVDKE